MEFKHRMVSLKHMYKLTISGKMNPSSLDNCFLDTSELSLEEIMTIYHFIYYIKALVTLSQKLYL